MSGDMISIISAGLVILGNQLFNIIRTQLNNSKENVKLTQLILDVEVIKKEVLPNGGGSMKDKVNKLNESITKIATLSEKKWHLQLDAMQTPIYVHDLNGECIYANDIMAELFQMPKHEFLKNGWISRIKNKPQAFNNWNESVQKNIPYRDEYELVNDAGKVYAKCTTRSELIKDASDTPLFYYGQITEVNKL